MFSNIGGKIKSVAIVWFWIGTLVSCFYGVLFWASGDDQGGSLAFIVGLLVVVAGVLASWISSLLLYGVGQLIDNTDILVNQVSGIIDGQEKGLKEQSATKEILSSMKQHILHPLQQERVHNDGSSLEEVNLKERVFPVLSYNPEVPIRNLKVHMDERGRIRLSFWSNQSSMEALQVKPTFTTVFDEIKEIGQLQYARTEKRGEGYVTEYIYSDKIRELFYKIKDVTLTVTKYVQNNSVIAVTEQDKRIDVSEEELAKLQTTYGPEAVGEYLESATSWTCICGKESVISEDCCSLCNHNRTRLKEGGLSESDVFESLLHYAEKEEVCTVKQINEFFQKLEVDNKGALYMKFLEDMNKMLEMERYYGYSKKSATNVIKSYIEKAKV